MYKGKISLYNFDNSGCKTFYYTNIVRNSTYTSQSPTIFEDLDMTQVMIELMCTDN